MARRSIQEINAGSMADIAFLLLIFFLVATTMNVETGLQRILPPIAEEKNDSGVDVNQRNLLPVFVSPDNLIMVGGERMDIRQVKDKAKEFILNVSNDPNLPDKVDTEIELIGVYPVSKGVISLRNDRGTSYNTYLMVQNELTRAFNEVRDELSMEKFGKKFLEASEEQREAVQKAVKLQISEAEPRNVGGK